MTEAAAIMPRARALAVAVGLACGTLFAARAFAEPPKEPLQLAQADPLSKDALFGTSAPPEKADKKDALFGVPAADEKGGGKDAVKVTGFFDALGAFTYSDPTHWSRGVARLQLNAQGALPGGAKWKVGGRVDGDVIYAGSEFYLDPVKKNQQLTAIWGENYVDFSAGDWDFRIGAQQIVWGEVIGLFFADVVSARDMREFLLPSFDIIRIPQAAARAEYTTGDAHLELIWIPFPAFDNIGKPGSDFYPAPLPSPTTSSVAALFRNPERPSSTLSNSNYGVRGNTLLSGWDLSAFYYRSYSTQPTFYRIATGDPAQPLVFQPSYDRIWQVGGTVGKDLGEAVLKGEVVYAHGQGYSLANLAAPQSVVTRSTLDYILSVEFSLPNDTRLNLQGFQRVFFDGGGSDLAVRSDGFGASVFLSTKLGNAWEPQLLWIQNFDHGGGLIRPRLNWTPAKNTTVGFGVDIFTGPDDGYFGRYDNRDRIYGELRYDF
jgi:hypothetical protein